MSNPQNLLYQFEPLRCTKHPQAALANVCAHVLDGAAPAYADESSILCEDCTSSKDDATRPIWPVCVACLRAGWGLTLRAVIEDLKTKKPEAWEK